MEEAVLNPTTALAGLRGQTTSYRKSSPLVPSLEGGLSLKCVEGGGPVDDGDLRPVLERYIYMYMYMLWYKNTFLNQYIHHKKNKLVDKSKNSTKLYASS